MILEIPKITRGLGGGSTVLLLGASIEEGGEVEEDNLAASEVPATAAIDDDVDGTTTIATSLCPSSVALGYTTSGSTR